MSTLRVLSRNVSWNYVEAGVSLVVYFLLTPFVIGHLGATGYGIWILLKTILYCLRFLDLGFYNALVKYVAEYAEHRDWPTVNALVATTVSALTVAGVVALAGSGLIAWLLVPHAFHVPPDRVSELQVATLLIGLELLLAFPVSVLSAVFEGAQRFDVMSGVAIAAMVVTALGTVVVLDQGGALPALVGVDIAGTLFSAGVLVVALRRVLPEVRLRWGRLTGAHVRRLRSYSAWTSLNEILAEGSVELEKLLLPMLLSVTLLTPYTLVCKVASAIFLAVEPITHTFFPLSSAYGARQDHARQRELLIRGTKLVMALALPLAVAAMAYGAAFIVAWIGAEHVVVPPGVMPLVVASFTVTAFVTTSITILLALARVRDVFWMSVTEFALAIGLVVIATPRWGLVGLAGSLVLANVVITFFWTVPAVCRLLDQGVAAFVGRSLLRPLAAAVPMLAVIPWLDRWLPGMAVGWLIAKSALAGGVYLLAFGALALTGEERLLWYSSARQLLGRAAE